MGITQQWKWDHDQGIVTDHDFSQEHEDTSPSGAVERKGHEK